MANGNGSWITERTVTIGVLLILFSVFAWWFNGVSDTLNTTATAGDIEVAMANHIAIASGQFMTQEDTEKEIEKQLKPLNIQMEDVVDDVDEIKETFKEYRKEQREANLILLRAINKNNGD